MRKNQIAMRSWTKCTLTGLSTSWWGWWCHGWSTWSDSSNSLNTLRKRSNIQKQNLRSGISSLSGQDSSLNSSSVSNSLIGINSLGGFLSSKEFRDETLYLGNTAGSSNKNNIILSWWSILPISIQFTLIEWCDVLRLQVEWWSTPHEEMPLHYKQGVAESSNEHVHRESALLDLMYQHFSPKLFYTRACISIEVP